MSADLVIEAPSTRLAIGSPRNRAGSGQDTGVRPDSAAALPGPAGQHSAPHLAAESLPGWRALLESHWRARLERVTELSLAYHDAEEAGAGYAGRRAEGGRPGTGQTRPLLRQAVAERRALAEIEAALSRLSNGCFGRCERCGGIVPAARLTRSPEARFCGTCDH
jgi:RNA polymerase-binding transcription factor